MYNRYVRTDQGTYTRIPQEEPPEHGAPPPPRGAGAPPPPPPGPAPPPGGGAADGLSGLLRRVLDQLHLDRIDTGDLLLLGLLFLLFREGADEELLIALGLLLIL